VPRFAVLPVVVDGGVRMAPPRMGGTSLRRWLAERRIRTAIPSTATRTVPYPLDRRAHRRRNLIERLFCRLKNWRRLATRYDRLARNYLAGLALVAIDRHQPGAGALSWTRTSPTGL